MDILTSSLKTYLECYELSAPPHVYLVDDGSSPLFDRDNCSANLNILFVSLCSLTKTSWLFNDSAMQANPTIKPVVVQITNILEISDTIRPSSSTGFYLLFGLLIGV